MPLNRGATIRGNINLINRGLEQRVLYHDVDKGMPCFGCDACPGFQMHFWRKLCTHCGCPQSDHDQKASTHMGVGRLRGLSVYNKKPKGERRRSSILSESDQPTPPPEPEVVVEPPPQVEAEPEPPVEETPPVPPTPSPPAEEEEEEEEEAEEEEEEEEEEVVIIYPDHEPHPPPAPKAHLKYLWYPRELTDAEVEVYFEPFAKDHVPLRGSAGELFYFSLIRKQLPAYDVDKKLCCGLKEEDVAAFEKFVQEKVAHFSDCGSVVYLDNPRKCHHCDEWINPGDMCIETSLVKERSGQNAVFHRDTCFKCEVCDSPFAELLCFTLPDKDVLLCSRDYNNALKPRCCGCDETIFDEVFTQADDGSCFHEEHFACKECDLLLHNEQYIMVNAQPVCIACYEDLHAPSCEACGELIATSDIKVTDGKKNGRTWHNECFTCCVCDEELRGRVCIPRDGKLYCREDYQMTFKKVARKSTRKKGRKVPGSAPSSTTSTTARPSIATLANLSPVDRPAPAKKVATPTTSSSSTVPPDMPDQQAATSIWSMAQDF